MKYSKLIYWTSTIMVSLFVGLGSFADLLKIEAVRQSFRHINFPEYMLPLFGIAKLGGSIAILIRSRPLLREWAYAGLIFYFIGANYIHMAVGDGIEQIWITLLILLMLYVSYQYSKNVYFMQG